MSHAMQEEQRNGRSGEPRQAVLKTVDGRLGQAAGSGGRRIILRAKIAREFCHD